MSNEAQAPQQEQKLFVTSEEILNATLKYLSSRPYAEVSNLIDALRRSQPLKSTQSESLVNKVEEVGTEEVETKEA